MDLIRILIQHDIEKENDSLSRHLSQIGQYNFDVRIIGSSQSLLTEIESFLPEIVFVNYSTDDQQGNERIQQAVLKYPLIGFLLLTGSETTNTKLKSCDYISIQAISKELLEKSVTELLQRNSILRQTKLLMNCVNESIVVVNQSGFVAFSNQNAATTLGYSKYSLTGMLLTELIREVNPVHPLLDLGSRLDECSQPGMGRNLFADVIRSDKSVFQGEIGINKVQCQREAFFTLVVQDSLEKNQHKIVSNLQSAALDLSSEIILFTDYKGCITYINRAGKNYLGISLDDYAAQLNIQQFFADRPKSGNFNTQIITELQSHRQVKKESVLTDTSGNKTPISDLTATAIHDHANNILAIAYIVHKNNIASLPMYQTNAKRKVDFDCYSRTDNRDFNKKQFSKSERTVKKNRHKFNLYYQPILSGSGTTIGIEALVCSNKHSDIIISAEDRITWDELERLILDKLIPLWENWYASGYRGFISINLSVRQLTHTNLLSNLKNKLQNLGLPVNKFCIEVREQALNAPLLEAKTIQKLNNTEFLLAIDAYGKDNSAFQFLLDLPVDVIKIDNSLISTVPGNPKNRQLILALIAMATSMGCKIVLEGITSKAHYDALTRLGEHVFYQGDYFGSAMPEYPVSAWIAGSNVQII